MGERMSLSEYRADLTADLEDERCRELTEVEKDLTAAQARRIGDL